MTALQELLKKKKAKAIQYRGEKGFTLQEIAVELQVSMSTAQRWLKDTLRSRKPMKRANH